MNGQLVILKHWEVVMTGDVYTPPECRVAILHGKAENHPEFERGAGIYTSPILSADGCVVSCASRQYLLDGPPSESYRKYLDDAGIVLDPKNPVRVRALAELKEDA